MMTEVLVIQRPHYILECCKDIKVLQRKDIRSLLSWWKAVKGDTKIKNVEKSVEKICFIYW